MYATFLPILEDTINPMVLIYPIEDEIGLLQDVPSYYIKSTLFNADTLTGEWVSETFHNYGNRRVRVQSDAENRGPVDKVTNFEIVNDSFWLQTEMRFSGIHMNMDSVLVYLKDGKISVVIDYRYGNGFRQYNLEYEGKKLSVKKVLRMDKHSYEIRHTYKDGKLVRLEKTSTRYPMTSLTTYVYKDSAVTETYNAIKGEMPTQTKTIHRTNRNGDMVSKEIMIQKGAETSTLETYMTLSYDYHLDGSYTKLFFYPEDEWRHEVTVSPGDPEISTYVWPNEGQKLIEKKYNTTFGIKKE